MLTLCSEIWGAATIIDSDPASITVQDALYLPLRPDIFLDRDPGWGIYDRDGSLVHDAAYYRLPTNDRVGQSETVTPPPVTASAPHGTYLYGGPIIMHYGHFLTAALPRLWQIARAGLPQGTRILVHSHQSPQEWFERDYARTILHRLGLSPDDFLQFDEPTRIRRLHVPRPAIQEQTFGHRVFRNLCGDVGAPLAGSAQPGRVVYLSKTRLTNNTYAIVNEQPIEDALTARGIEIVYPETLAFADQVAMLASCRAVLGTIGSAFHTSIFCPAPIRFIGLAYGPRINANYAIIDGLMGNDSLYVYPDGLTEVAPETATFCYRLTDPEAIAQDLLQLL